MERNSNAFMMVTCLAVMVICSPTFQDTTDANINYESKVIDGYREQTGDPEAPHLWFQRFTNLDYFSSGKTGRDFALEPTPNVDVIAGFRYLLQNTSVDTTQWSTDRPLPNYVSYQIDDGAGGGFTSHAFRSMFDQLYPKPFNTGDYCETLKKYSLDAFL